MDEALAEYKVFVVSILSPFFSFEYDIVKKKKKMTLIIGTKMYNKAFNSFQA